MGLYDDLFPSGGGFGSSADLQAPSYSGLIPSLTGGSGAASGPAMPATLANISALAAKAPIRSFEEFNSRRNLIDDMNDHGIIPALFGGNDRTADYLKYLAGALGVSGAAQNNDLGAMKVAGYQRLQALNGGAPATRPGAFAGAGLIPSLTGGGGDTAAAPVTAGPPPVPGVFGNTTTLGAAPAAMPQPASTAAPAPASPAPATRGGQPRPLLNVANLRDQYAIMASTPGMEQQASGVLTALMKGVPDGAYLGEDGGIYDRNGYLLFKQREAFANGYGDSQGRLPAELTKNRQDKDLALRNDKGIVVDRNGNAVAVPQFNQILANAAGLKADAEVPAANARTRFQTDEEIRKAGPISQATLPADLTKQTNQADLTARNDKGIAFTPQGAVEIPNYQAIQQGDQRFKTDEEIRKAKAVPQDVGPGTVRVERGPDGNMVELYRSPFPAPGTPENEQNRLRGKTAGEMYDEAVKGGKAALEQNALLQTQLEQLDQGLSTGSAFDTRRAISNLIATMGGDPEKAGLMDPTKAAQFNTISRELLVNRAKAFGANPSNAEDRYLLQSIDTSNDPAAAAKALIQWRMGRNNALAQYGAGMHEAVDIKGQHPVSYAYDFARKNPGFTQPNPPGATNLNALPAGSKAIGTYQGKTVYQTPDGRKVVEQ